MCGDRDVIDGMVGPESLAANGVGCRLSRQQKLRTTTSLKYASGNQESQAAHECVVKTHKSSHTHVKNSQESDEVSEGLHIP